MTNLGFSHPDLFYHLPCQFNRQTSIDYLRPPWLDSFHSYHHCDLPRNIKIFHRNGCGPTPRCCGHQYLNDRKSVSLLYDVNLDVEQFWLTVSKLSSLRNSSSEKFSFLLGDSLIMNCVLRAQEFCQQVVNRLLPID